jgi:hypothetical protein
MQIKSIKMGRWYRTAKGVGKCLTVGGTHPPSVAVNIVAPFPRGRVYLSPREVLEEIDPPEPVAPDEES